MDITRCITGIKWYRSKTDVYIARGIWFLTGIFSIYSSYNQNIQKINQILFLILGILCIFVSFIAGRWSFKEDVK